MRHYLLIPALIMSFSLGAAENMNSSMAPKAGEIVWNELATPNLQAAKKFYGKVFGWEFVDKNMDDMSYTIIKKGNKEFGGIWGIPASMQDQIPPHWLAYISVDNLKQALDTAQQNGATVVKQIQKAGDMGIFAIIQDPTGAHIALWQSLKSNRE